MRRRTTASTGPTGGNCTPLRRQSISHLSWPWPGMKDVHDGVTFVRFLGSYRDSIFTENVDRLPCNVGFNWCVWRYSTVVHVTCTYFQRVRHRLLLRHLTRPGYHLLQRKGDRLLKEETGSGRNFHRHNSFYLWLRIHALSILFTLVYTA